MKFQAILLLGPTGSGKSPLGDWLERVSLWDRRCHHFDFGANLRAAVSDKGAGIFNAKEIQLLKRVLEEGALLEDEQFPLAARILDTFIAQRVACAGAAGARLSQPQQRGRSNASQNLPGAVPNEAAAGGIPALRKGFAKTSGSDGAQCKGMAAEDLLVLNGLPRHLSQARAVEQKVSIIGVVQLDCDAATVAERLRRNSSGDRAQRWDDGAALIARKLEIYTERTIPLLDYYRRRGVPVLKVVVGIKTQPAEIARQIEDWLKHP